MRFFLRFRFRGGNEHGWSDLSAGNRLYDAAEFVWDESGRVLGGDWGHDRRQKEFGPQRPVCFVQVVAPHIHYATDMYEGVQRYVTAVTIAGSLRSMAVCSREITASRDFLEQFFNGSTAVIPLFSREFAARRLLYMI